MYLSHDIEIVLKEKALLDKQVHVHSDFFLDSIKYSPPPKKKKKIRKTNSKLFFSPATPPGIIREK